MTLFRGDTDPDDARPTPADVWGAVIWIVMTAACAGIVARIIHLSLLAWLGR